MIIHGLFGSKKNNRSVSKYVAIIVAAESMLISDTVRSLALSTAQCTPLTRETTATHRTTKYTTTTQSPTMSKPF